MLYEAARVWNAEKYLSGTILDVGCGLGGGALFWAQEYGARVFALTNVPKHTELVARFAAQGGVADQVVPLLGDACLIPEDQIFDAAVAVQSSCYFDREVWFKCLFSRLQPSGHVFVLDIFLESENSRDMVDRYYKICIGSVNDYKQAAAAASFRFENMLDITSRCILFWEFSKLYSRRLLESGKVTDEKEVQRLERSIRFQTWFLQQYVDRGIICALLSFVRS
jgi:tocopherol O-methyltransferase